MAKPKKSTKKKPSIDAFIKHYLLSNGNGTQAAIDAGYSPKTAHQQASRLLKSVKVKEKIAEAQNLKTEKFIWDKTKKLEILQGLIDSSISVAKDTGKIENATAAIQAIKEHNLMQGDNAATVTEIKVDRSFNDFYDE